MEDKDMMIPMVVLESCEMRHDKRERRKDIIIIILILVILGMAGLSAYERLQYDYSSESSVIEQNADTGDANYIQSGGDVNNGISEGD